MHCLRFSVSCLLLSNLFQIHKAPIRFPGVWLTRRMWGNESRTHMIEQHETKHIFNTLISRRNGQHFADDIFKRFCFKESIWISINISLKCVPKGSNYNILAMIQIMVWRRPGDNPLSVPIMVSLPTHRCVTPLQWVNSLAPGGFEANFRLQIFTLVLVIDGWDISCNLPSDERHWTSLMIRQHCFR